MTAQRTGSPTRSVVLGGGGAVGIGWQVGVLLGLRSTGIDLQHADLVFGTSAGAVVGALLADGRDIHEAFASLQGLGRSMEPAALRRGNDLFLDAMRDADLDPGSDPTTALQIVGRAARRADALDEPIYLRLFDIFLAAPWPSGFSCTAVDADSGAVTVWSEESGVPLREAVAASCALPMLFPPVTINGHHYLDGGLISHLNATAAPAADVTVVLSCHPLLVQAASAEPAPTASEMRADAELAALQKRSRVAAFEPDFSEIGATPETMMDQDTARRAMQVGAHQAARITEVVRGTWNVQDGTSPATR